jgi:hypothetical protein
MSEVYGYRGYQDADEAFEERQEINAEMRLQLRARIMEIVTCRHDEGWHMRQRQREQILKGDER